MSKKCFKLNERKRDTYTPKKKKTNNNINNKKLYGKATK